MASAREYDTWTIWKEGSMVWNTDVPTGMLGKGRSTQNVLINRAHYFFSIKKRFKYKMVLEWIDLAITAQVFFSHFAAPAITSHLLFSWLRAGCRPFGCHIPAIGVQKGKPEDIIFLNFFFTASTSFRIYYMKLSLSFPVIYYSGRGGTHVEIRGQC